MGKKKKTKKKFSWKNVIILVSVGIVFCVAGFVLGNTSGNYKVKRITAQYINLMTACQNLYAQCYPYLKKKEK